MSENRKRNFVSVTECGGEQVSHAQIERVAQRYYWAGEYCRDKDVLEIACGVGQGLGYLQSVSKSLRAGDITSEIVNKARSYYGDRISITEMDAETLPFESSTLDVVILFEAIYYLPNVKAFITECLRVLRTDGVVLLATANRNLTDFNPSPYSVCFYNPPELKKMFLTYGFKIQFFGGNAISNNGIKNRVIRLLKKQAIRFNLIPKSMKGKRWLKRLVFGKLAVMPHEVKANQYNYIPPRSIDGNHPDFTHQVLYCAARKIRN